MRSTPVHYTASTGSLERTGAGKWLLLLIAVFLRFFIYSILVFQLQPTGRKQGKEKNMENQNMETKTETEGVGADTGTVQESTEKLFTQEQVNEIIKKRLKNQKEIESSMQEVNTRTAELTARENRLSCREYLLEKGYPAELLDIIDTSDVDTFKNKADKASVVFESRQHSRFVAPLASTESIMQGNISHAFENTKHQPKQYPPR